MRVPRKGPRTRASLAWVEQRAEVGLRHARAARGAKRPRGSRRVERRVCHPCALAIDVARRLGGDVEMGQARHDGLALRTLTDVGDDPAASTAPTRVHVLQINAADERSTIDAWRR